MTTNPRRSPRSLTPTDEPPTATDQIPEPPTSSVWEPEPVQTVPPRFATVPQPEPPSPPDGEHGEPAATDEPPAKTTPGSSPASTRALGALLAPIVAQLVAMVSFFMHSWRTPGDDNAVWLAAERELADIAAPASRIIARRLPAGIASGDVGDGVELVTAAGAYAMRGVAEEVDYKRGQRGAAQPVEPETNGDASTVPAAAWPTGHNPLENIGRV